MSWKNLCVIVALAGVTAACSEDSPTDPNTDPLTVEVDDDVFRPGSLEVAVGETVTWDWVGGSDHNVAFDDGPTSDTQSDGTFTRTFSEAGEYPYHCEIHGTFMSGTVVVE